MTTATQELLTLSAPVELQARDADKPALVSIEAYTGGLMSVPGWGPVVVDTAGLNAGTVTLLVDHDSTLGGVIGSGNASITAGRVFVSGTISRSSEAGPRVIAMSQDGVQWQASIGVKPSDAAFIDEGDSVFVNGRTISAPRGGMHHVKAGHLREVSITALGADGNTNVSIKGRSMKFQEWLQAKGFDPEELSDQQEEYLKSQFESARTNPTKPKHSDSAIEARAADWDRVGKIEQLGTTYPGSGQIIATAIRENWEPSRAELECMRSARPAPGFSINRGAAGAPRITPETLSAAFSLRFDGSAAEKDYDERTLEAADGLSRMSFCDLAARSLEAAGQTVPRNKTELIRAATGVSTFSLTNALSDSRSKSLLRHYKQRPATFRTIAADNRRADNFHNQTEIRISEFPNLQPLGPDGEMRHGDLSESPFTWRLETFARMIGISRQQMINDDLGAFDQLPQGMARGAIRTVSDEFWKLFLPAVAGFYVDNENKLPAGASSALSVDSLSTAITLLRKQRDDDGNDLDLMPTNLVVPPELEKTATEVVKSERVVIALAGGTDQTLVRPDGNGMHNVLEVVVEPRMSNTDKYSGASGTHWLVTADKMDAPALVGYLNGQQAPTVEFFGLDHVANKLQVQWRIYLDFGVALGDRKASVYSPGG